MKRISLFFGNFNSGGVQRVRLILAKGFLERGFFVDIVVVNSRGALRKQVPVGANIIDLGARSALASLPALTRYLRRKKPDAILSAQTHHNITAIWARRLSGVSARLIVGEHNNLQEVVKYSTFRNQLRPLAARLIYPGADAILAVSKGVADALSVTSGIKRADIHVIYNPVMLSDIQKRIQEGPEHPWQKQKHIPVIIAVGSLREQKDYPTLIKAFAKARANRSMRLIILGEGRCREQLQTLINKLNLAEDVHLKGNVANPYIYMQHADLYVLSSRWEGFPNALLEALACGAPIVATDCPSGPAEMLENGRYGHLVPVGDEDALAEAIQKTLDFPPSSILLKKRASEFSLEVICEQYLRLLVPHYENTAN